MVAYDQQSLKCGLTGLTRLGRMLFALSCAERLYPLYELYTKETGKENENCLRSILDGLWKSVVRGETIAEESSLDDYDYLIPNDSAEWTRLNPLAENAAAALAYAWRLHATGETQNAVWAATQGYEAVDYIAHTLQAIDFNEPGAEGRILQTEYVQAELQRQLRDLAELESVSNVGTQIDNVVKTLQNRAKAEGNEFVPLASALWQARPA